MSNPKEHDDHRCSHDDPVIYQRKKSDERQTLFEYKNIKSTLLLVVCSQ